MMLSVCCITYNQEKFIKKAIESMLAQQTSFDVEIVIGEDGSTDATRGICEALLQQFPQKIKLLPDEGNLGMNPNLERTLKACSGKYIAICEGDDYWTDTAKLQQQVDFLDANPSFAICYHRVYELFGKKPLQLETINTSEEEKEYTLHDLAKGNFIYTPSVVFRNHLIRDYPSWFSQSPVGDYVLHMLNARHGKIKYLPAPMAAYRRHAQGAWGLKNSDYHTLNFIKVIDLLVQEFEGETKNLMVKQKVSRLSELARRKYYEKEFDQAKEYLEKLFALDPSFREQWLTTEYPALIKNIYMSRKYKMADRAAFYLRKIGVIK